MLETFTQLLNNNWLACHRKGGVMKFSDTLTIGKKGTLSVLQQIELRIYNDLVTRTLANNTDSRVGIKYSTETLKLVRDLITKLQKADTHAIGKGVIFMKDLVKDEINQYFSRVKL